MSGAVPESATVPELLAALAAGELTSVDLTQDALDRIAARDGEVRSVLAIHPDALAQAAARDERRARGEAPGPLDGIPVLIKDNIAVAGRPTTAGSRALADSAPPDAALVTRLREAGAVVLGKTNLSEWANFRSTRSSSGWSAIGGQTRNPHALDRTPSGSSSGSAAAVAAGLVPLAIGTETDGSIVSPAGTCGVVGLKPTLGTIPGAGIVPISSAQDTAGPMSRFVVDAAIGFAVLAGRPMFELDPTVLRGLRIGVWRPDAEPATAAVLDAAVAALVGAGADPVDAPIDLAGLTDPEWSALCSEFRHELNAYLAAAPGSGPRDLAALLDFNRRDEVELSRFGQETFERCLTARPIEDAGYRAERQAVTTAARQALDGVFGRGVDVVLTLSNDPAWPIDYEAGDDYRNSTSSAAAVSGYPSISVPAGSVGLLPIGVSFIGPAGADERLLQIAAAFEELTSARRDPTFAQRAVPDQA